MRVTPSKKPVRPPLTAPILLGGATTVAVEYDRDASMERYVNENMIGELRNLAVVLREN